MAINGGAGGGRRAGMATREEAERLSVAVLSFLAGEPAELARFLSLTGLTPRTLRAAAADPQFAGSVLDYLLGNEPMLLVFAERSGLPPDWVASCRRALD